MQALLTAAWFVIRFCHSDDEQEKRRNEKYDLSLPTLNEDGWYLVFDDTKAADDFEVEYIKVYQNSNYEQYIQDDSEFDGSVDLN